jgi:hypothetical protein
MAALPSEILIFAIALIASLVLGVMARFATADGTAAGYRFVFNLFRRRWLIVLIVMVIGAGLGLWTFDDVRRALFDMVGGFMPGGGGDA